MKKIIALTATLAMLVAAAFAQEIEIETELTAQSAESPAVAETSHKDASRTKKWTNNMGVGIAVPFSKYNVGGSTIDQTSIALNFIYMGVHTSGFTIKALANTGVALTKNLAFAGDDGIQGGTFLTMELGAGYSFLRTEKLTLSALAMLGFEVSDYETESETYTHKELGKVDRSYTATLSAFTAGGDVTATLCINPKFCLFASVAGRFFPYADIESSVNYKSGDFTRTETYKIDDYGIFSVTPAVGVMWRW